MIAPSDLITGLPLAQLQDQLAAGMEQLGVEPTPKGLLEVCAEIVIIGLLVLGTMFCVLAAIGMARMPDVYSRMQAATKAGTLGVACLLLATSMHAASLPVIVEGILVILFLFLTSPIASHLIARSAYFVDVPRWKNTTIDELKGCYDPNSHRLDSGGDQDLGHAPAPIPHPAGQRKDAQNRGDSETPPIAQAR